MRHPKNTSKPDLSSYCRSWHTGHLRLKLAISPVLETLQHRNASWDTEFIIARTEYLIVSLYKTYLDKLHKFILCFKKQNWRLFSANHRAAIWRSAKMLPSDWFRKYFSINFVRVNKLNVFMRQLPTENLRQLLNT